MKERYGTSTCSEEESGRLVQHVEDLDTVSEETVKNLCTGTDVFFCCLGCTKAQAGSSEAFFHIDCEVPERIAKIAKTADVKHASLLTSTRANPNSWLLYLRTKGEIEERTKNLKFNRVSIFRPGLLGRGAGNMRFGEKVAKIFFRPMLVEDLAKAMVQDALNISSSSSEGSDSTPAAVYENADIWRISGESKL